MCYEEHQIMTYATLQQAEGRFLDKQNPADAHTWVDMTTTPDTASYSTIHF